MTAEDLYDVIIIITIMSLIQRIFCCGYCIKTLPPSSKAQYHYNDAESKYTVHLEKPVIYLYSNTSQPQEVAVNLSLKQGQFTEINPPFSQTNGKYNGQWNTTVTNQGILIDRQYLPSLYWESLLKPTEYQTLLSAQEQQHSRIIPASMYSEYLTRELSDYGLNDIEINDFLIYWLPRLEEYPAAKIVFDTTFLDLVSTLIIVPGPASIIRLFVHFHVYTTTLPSIEQYTASIKNLSTTLDRSVALCCIEWGGCISHII